MSSKACETFPVRDASFEIRAARDEDRLPLAVLFAAVAEERDSIGAEPPVDVDARAAAWNLDGALVAVAGGEIVGWLHVARTSFGFGEIGMLVAREWRGRGVGSALLMGAIRVGARAQPAQADAHRLRAQRGCDRALPQVSLRRRGPSCEAFPARERGALGCPRDGAPALTCALGRAMADDAFEHPRLAAIYDALDADRSDLDVYLDIAAELGARRVLDVGCGTGTFAILLAERGFEVAGVDPALASLDVARGKPFGARVRWIHGDATSLPSLQVDLATMTGNVAQAIVERADWEATLEGIHGALCPAGCLVFETRDPAYRAWQGWNRAASYRVTEIDGVGAVESWHELTDVSGSLVSFRSTAVFASDGEVLTSESTLRFREREEIQASLVAHGYVVDDVRSAPDRPGRELVFFARRPG
jgi:SAM-dependent methyltransferase/GNAT superfamily N-acetyltransferase